MTATTGRRRVAGVLAAAAVACGCFAPVFGLAAVAVPVVAVCLACLLAVELSRWSVLAGWRPVLVAGAGVLATVETTLFATTAFGVPTAATGRALWTGLSSWRRTLESTWPAQPDPDLLLFVPLLAVVSCLLGVELLDRAGPLPALLPSVAVLGLAQAYDPVSGTAVHAVAAGYAVAAALVLVPSAGHGRTGQPRRKRRIATPVAAATVLALATGAGGYVLAGADPFEREPVTLQRVQASGVAPRSANPLDDVARRLADPDAEVFRYRTDAPVDRWRMVALDEFDGTNWTTERPVLRFGTELALADAVEVPTVERRADVDVREAEDRWLPSQPLPRSVRGAGETYVEPVGGTLLAGDPTRAYTLTWSTPQVTAERLGSAAVDPRAATGDLAHAPRGIASLAEEATGGGRASFRTALALERYLSTEYELTARGERPESGHGWPQLEAFLTVDRRGTSEQFAAAYVTLARLSGIPARLVVGYRAPLASSADGWTTVRNRDVLVWPEVAVDGIGWWPLDPAGLADRAESRTGGTDQVTEKARATLPPPERLDDEENGGDRAGGRQDRSPALPVAPDVRPLLPLLAVPMFAWVCGVPLARWTRRRLRRTRRGTAAVTAAWAEARDRLRAHGVTVSPGMTVRDVAAAATPVADARVHRGLDRIAETVDRAHWSGMPFDRSLPRDAWRGTRDVTRGLSARPGRARLRAAYHVRSLRRP